MACPVVKLLSDINNEVVVSCDLDEYHIAMHHDQIHNVYWPNDAVVREPMKRIVRKLESAAA